MPQGCQLVSSYSTGNTYTWNQTYAANFTTQTTYQTAATVYAAAYYNQPVIQVITPTWIPFCPPPARVPARVELRTADAYSKAQHLLESMLKPEQLEEMIRHKHFHVRGSSGRRYRISTHVGVSGNVDLVDDHGGFVGRFCAHPMNVPAPDVFVAQMLALESDEDAFLRVANLHAGHMPDRPLVTL